MCLVCGAVKACRLFVSSGTTALLFFYLFCVFVHDWRLLYIFVFCCVLRFDIFVPCFFVYVRYITVYASVCLISSHDRTGVGIALRKRFV